MKFSEFLKREGIFEEVLKCSKCHSDFSHHIYVDDNKGDGLEMLFNFHDTPQGYDYWDTMRNRIGVEVDNFDMVFMDKRDALNHPDAIAYNTPTHHINEIAVDQALNCIIKDCDLGENVTLRYFLSKLLSTLWIEEESFSGKRPFGNSGWQYSIYNSLAENKLIPSDGVPDENGDYNYNTKEAKEFVLRIIEETFK
jgi:hypothetical protein